MSSGRASIPRSIANKIKEIKGQSPYLSNLHENVETKLRFWDEITDFPFVCVVAGDEIREYHPASFKWGFLNVSIKIYVQEEESLEVLENIISDIERVIDSNNKLQYESDKHIEQIKILNISTDGGVMNPLGVGEILIEVQYVVE